MIQSSSYGFDVYAWFRRERQNTFRRTLVRYINLANAILFQTISGSAKKRFPTMTHLVGAVKGFIVMFQCNQSESAESFTKEELRQTCHYAVFEDNMSSCRGLKGENHQHDGSLVATASSAVIRAQVTPSLGAFVSSRTIRSRLDEGRLGSRCPLHVLPLTPTHQFLRLEWCRARGNWIEAEGKQVVFCEESIFKLSSDDNRVRAWRPPGECLNPVFSLQRHTSSTVGGMAWSVIAYNTQSPLVLIRGAMTAQRYVHDILKPHVLPLMQRLPGVIFQQDNARPHTAMVSQDCLSPHCNYSFFDCPIPRLVSNPAYLGSFGMVSCALHKFERTRGKVTGNMERNVSRHHSELVCLNDRSYRIVYSH
ncbi:transposable element Tcb1 transposase [Trichonephila clavipes]|nr:transposable element Tcb1 transposase [Trichonephila clavipes]